ncbi:MAG: sigma-70 family RNA polymerase sigma factor [Planctomycetota bacterium]|jgi:RNA polymerase sigma-70 factor (ECF subfamily)
MSEPAAIGNDDARLGGLDPSCWLADHGDALFRFALLRVRDPKLAEDMVQETFVAALAARSRFAGRSSERTWLVGILKRKVADHFRRASRSQPVTDVTDSADAHESLFDGRGKWIALPAKQLREPGTALEQQEFWGAFYQCLSALPGRLAEAFCLRELDNMPGKDICKVLDVSATNLWVWLHRARGQLRRCMERRWFGNRAGR